MIKRLGISGAVVAVMALAAGSVGPAAGSGNAADNARDRTIRVVSINTEEEFVDVGAPDFSLGDSFIFRSKLMRHGHQVGHTGVVCTITSADHEESQCVGTARFRRGQITIQGLLAGEPETFVFPVTGGSGAFEGVHGVLQVRELSGTRERLTFHLSR